MCVKLMKNNVECPYDTQKDFLTNVKGCSEVVVKYAPNDVEIEKLVEGIEHCVKTGVSLTVALRIDYNDFLDGYKTKKQLVKAMSDISINEVVKLMTLVQHSADAKLKELSDMCNREINGK